MIGFAAERLMKLQFDAKDGPGACRMLRRPPGSMQRLLRPGLGDPRTGRSRSSPICAWGARASARESDGPIILHRHRSNWVKN